MFVVEVDRRAHSPAQPRDLTRFISRLANRISCRVTAWAQGEAFPGLFVHSLAEEEGMEPRVLAGCISRHIVRRGLRLKAWDSQTSWGFMFKLGKVLAVRRRFGIIKLQH